MKKKEKSMAEVTKDYETFIKKNKLNPTGRILFEKSLKAATSEKPKKPPVSK